ncbi:hypothetical protein BC830DRAFT_1127468 [Chytriomyces sp. MP71]|nr:hypothetical protein BC830DRAFT_1127468 [Chytriomyces sp. MP71]
MEDFTSLFSVAELSAEPWLPEYVGEVLARWGRWAARQRPPHLCFEAATLSGMQYLEYYQHPPSERTERIERALAEAIAGSTVDELEPDATDAMREKAVLLMADEYLGKSATPALASDARKRAKNRRSKTLVKDKNASDKRTSSSQMYFNPLANAPPQRPQTPPLLPQQPTPLPKSMLAREGSIGRGSNTNSPRMRSLSANRDAVGKKISNAGLMGSGAPGGSGGSGVPTRRKPSNDPSIGSASDRLYERRGSSSSAEEYSSPTDGRYGSGGAGSSTGRHNNDAYGSRSGRSGGDDMYSGSSNARSYGGGGAGGSGNLALRKKSVDNINFGAEKSSNSSGSSRNPPYADYNNSPSASYRRKKSVDSVEASPQYIGSFDERDYRGGMDPRYYQQQQQGAPPIMQYRPQPGYVQQPPIVNAPPLPPQMMGYPMMQPVHYPAMPQQPMQQQGYFDQPGAGMRREGSQSGYRYYPGRSSGGQGYSQQGPQSSSSQSGVLSRGSSRKQQ